MAEEEWDIPDGEFCVYGTVYADPAHADSVALVYAETTRLAMHEPGTVSYHLSRDRADPLVFHFFERYRSKADFEKHNAHEIIQNFIKSGWMKNVKAVFCKPIEAGVEGAAAALEFPDPKK